MNERPSAGSGLVGYVIVLVGVAGFVLSCFLPYTTFGVLVGGGSPASSTFSFYRLITRNTPDGGTLQYVGGLLFLFGGAATVACVALAGLRHGHHERRRTPSILVAVTVAWSLSWFGLLVNASGFYDVVVGSWSMLVSAGVVIVGTIVVWVSARHATQEADSAAGPEPPTEVPVG
jgi:hypothetical protein